MNYSKRGYLYCARAGKYVKIGHSANPNKRLETLKHGTCKTYRYPEDAPLGDISIEGQAPAPRSAEMAFHRFFRDEVIPGTGEWYLAGGAAHKAIIDSLARLSPFL